MKNTIYQKHDVLLVACRSSLGLRAGVETLPYKEVRKTVRLNPAHFVSHQMCAHFGHQSNAQSG